MKKPKTTEDIRELALAHLDIAADSYALIEQGGVKKEIPEAVAKAFTVHIGAACRYWIKFRKRFEKEFYASFGKDFWTGRFQTGEWKRGKDDGKRFENVTRKKAVAQSKAKVKM